MLVQTPYWANKSCSEKENSDWKPTAVLDSIICRDRLESERTWKRLANAKIKDWNICFRVNKNKVWKQSVTEPLCKMQNKAKTNKGKMDSEYLCSKIISSWIELHLNSKLTLLMKQHPWEGKDCWKSTYDCRINNMSYSSSENTQGSNDWDAEAVLPAHTQTHTLTVKPPLGGLTVSYSVVGSTISRGGGGENNSGRFMHVATNTLKRCSSPPRSTTYLLMAK